MPSLVNCLVLCTLFAVTLSAETTSKVNVTVYFESYNPDCVKFLTEQLYPAYTSDFKNHIDVTLVPYGKTNKTETGFSCDNGPKECLGNKAIACILDNSTQTFEDQFKFINCTSTVIAKNFNQTYSVAVGECSKEVTPFKNNTLMACVNGPDSNKMLAKYGNMTDSLQKPLQSVPTIVFNGILNANETMKAFKNFTEVLCNKINGTKPASCGKSAAGTLQAAILTLLATLALAIRV